MYVFLLTESINRYPLWPFDTDADKAEFQRVVKQINTLLSTEFGELELLPLRLTRYFLL